MGNEGIAPYFLNLCSYNQLHTLAALSCKERALGTSWVWYCVGPRAMYVVGKGEKV